MSLADLKGLCLSLGENAQYLIWAVLVVVVGRVIVEVIRAIKECVVERNRQKTAEKIASQSQALGPCRIKVPDVIEVDNPAEESQDSRESELPSELPSMPCEGKKKSEAKPEKGKAPKKAV